MESAFKSINSKKPNRRTRKASTSESSDEEKERIKSTVETAKEIQKLRKRAKGISATELTLGKKVNCADILTCSDPFKLETGGLVNPKTLKSGKLVDSEGIAIGTAFSAETNCRDEDAEMMKYIEEELGKSKEAKAKMEKNKDSSGDHDSNDTNSNSEWAKRPEDALYAVPEHLRVSSTKKSEEMLSNQMLSGIPEVDLGIEAKIRNIEATEEAKQRLLKEKMNKKDAPSPFVPTNMAVNFVQHNRFNIETDGPKFKKTKDSKAAGVVAEADSSGVAFKPEERRMVKHKDDDEKATDDFHFEKFKKQFRRY
ncbi:hypothetical protein CHUAL_009292 [Chamberlinius hualienensis]